MLILQYTFKLNPILDANTGKLAVFKSATEISSLEEISMMDSQKTEVLKTRENLYFKVTGLGTTSMVVSYKINNVEHKTGLFDGSKDF